MVFSVNLLQTVPLSLTKMWKLPHSPFRGADRSLVAGQQDPVCRRFSTGLLEGKQAWLTPAMDRVPSLPLMAVSSLRVPLLLCSFSLGVGAP